LLIRLDLGYLSFPQDVLPASLTLQMHVICQDAVEKGFCRKRNLKCWAVVGASLFTMKCLTNEKVGRDGNAKNDPEFNKYQVIQSKNDYAILQLTVMGYMLIC
jgi:hypothetical protein